MSSYRKSKRRKFIDPDIIEVKSKFYAEFRRFALHKSECTKFARFRELLQETFVLNEMPFTICYTDPLHGDLLPINNDENFARALTTVTNNACLLRILLQKMDEDPGQITGYGNQPNSLKKRNRLSQYILNVVPNYYNIAAESLYTNLLLNTGHPVNSSHYTPDNGINHYPYQISNGDLHRRQKSSPILDPMYNTWSQQSTNHDVPPQNYYMPNHPHTIKLLNGHAAHNSISSTTHYQPTATQNYVNTPRASKPLIGRPLDFRTVSSIIDVDTVPKTLRRVRLVKPRRPVLPCPHSLITMTAKDNIGANNFDNYNTNHSSNHQYSSTSLPVNGLPPATAQSTPQYYDDRPLGFYIRQGISVRIGSEGLERYPAIFISRLVPGGIAAGTGLLSLGDEIVEVNGIDLSGKTLDQVTDMMIANAYDLVLTVRPADQASTLARGRPIIPSNYSAQGTTLNSALHNDESFPYTSSHSNNKFINSKSYHNINDEIHHNEGKSNAVSKDGPKILSVHENTMNGLFSTQSVTPAHTKTNINTSEIFNHIRNLNINENLTVYQNGIMNISTSKYGTNNFIPSTSISRTPEITNHDKTNNFYTPNGNDSMEFITPPSIKRRAPKPPLLCSKI